MAALGGGRRYMQRRRELAADYRAEPVMKPGELMIDQDEPRVRQLLDLAQSLGRGVSADSLAVLYRNGVPTRLVGYSVCDENGVPTSPPVLRPVGRNLDSEWSF